MFGLLEGKKCTLWSNTRTETYGESQVKTRYCKRINTWRGLLEAEVGKISLGLERRIL